MDPRIPSYIAPLSALLYTCPLMREAGMDEELFQQLLSALPLLSAQLQAIHGKDMLLALANDLGNMWMLVVEDDHEEEEDEWIDDWDDAPDAQRDDSQYVARARKLRMQSMRSFKAAVLDIKRSHNSFHHIYEHVAQESMEMMPVSIQLALRDAFDTLDFMVVEGMMADDVQRKDLKRRARQLSHPLLAPLLNAANPFRVLPTFVRLALRTGLAEALVMRGSRQRLTQLQQGLSPQVVTAIMEHVEQGHANNVEVARIQRVHLEQIPIQEEDEKEDALQLLKHATLVWQKRQLMQLYRRSPQVALLLDQVVPVLGVPLSALYDSLRVGDEIRSLGTILHEVARRPTRGGGRESLPRLRERVWLSTQKALREDRLHDNVHWLYESISEPVHISVCGLVRTHLLGVGEECALWAEVEEARTRLRRGEHFGELRLDWVRKVAPHFHSVLEKHQKEGRYHP